MEGLKNNKPSINTYGEKLITFYSPGKVARYINHQCKQILSRFIKKCHVFSH